MKELADGAILVAHSAVFEERFLRRELEALGGAWRQPMLCTLKLARALYPERKGRGAHTQAGLSELHGLDWGGPSHHALPDTIQLVALMLEMIRANIEKPELEDALTNAMIGENGSTDWPVAPTSEWLPRMRASDEDDDDDDDDDAEPAPTSQTARDPASPGHGKFPVALAVLIAAGVALYALSGLFSG